MATLKYTEISSMFPGFGTLLVDGHALISSQKSMNSRGINNPQLRKIIQNYLISMHESGFNKIKVFFFSDFLSKEELGIDQLISNEYIGIFEKYFSYT